MRILPINNTLSIQKYRPSFKEISEDGYSDFKDYVRTDSYVDETGLHFVHNRLQMPSFEIPNEDVFENRPLPKNVYAIREKVFLTQEQYDARNSISDEYYIRQEKKAIQKALYDLNLEKVDKYVKNLWDIERIKIISQPFFALGLADIPLTEQNKELYQDLLTRTVERTIGTTVNAMDENGITLLEKVMNAENEPYLNTIKEICRRHGNSDSPSGIAYEPMQKYAFDNIQNPEFKEQCKDLPIQFFDIIDDIERKDLYSLDKDIQEQMKCGFCDFLYAIRHSILAPALISSGGDNYAQIVLNIVKKHFPYEVKSYLRQINF